MIQVEHYRDLPDTAKPGDRAKVSGDEYVWRTHASEVERLLIARAEWQWWPVDMSVMDNVLKKGERR